MSETVIVKNTAKVSSIGIEGSVSTSAFWADTVYADSDKWTSATGCKSFTVRPVGVLTAGTHALIIAFSETQDDDLSKVIASIQTGTASLAKTAKEATLTEHPNVVVLTRDTQEVTIYNKAAIKTIRIVALGNDKVCELTTVTE